MAELSNGGLLTLLAKSSARTRRNTLRWEVFNAQRRRRLIGDGLSFLHSDEVRTVIHEDAKRGSCLRMWVNGRMMEGVHCRFMAGIVWR